MNYKVLDEEVIYEGKRILVRRDRVILPSSREVVREIVHHPGAAAIVPFLDRETILLIRHFRYSVRDFLWEIPAGTLEPPEPPAECAARELIEETAYKAGRMKLIAEYYPSPGICDEKMYVYRADDLERVGREVDSEVEAVVPMTVRELQGKYKAGKLLDGKTQYALKLAGIL